ncbi:MAG: lactate utilization protein [Candidatus Rokubacteria bacterium]|nr:lactate utilization protein [Candidatus Rokubacteria bacterium]
MTARAEFFGRIRVEMAKTRGLFPATPAERPAHAPTIADSITRELAERWPQTLERFQREFERVGGVFHRVVALGDVPALVGRLARERAARRVVAWHPSALGADLTPALGGEGLDAESMPAAGLGDERARAELRARIAAADIGLTGVDLAVAETGTLVLVSGSGKPRSTSLLPPTHVAVFDRTRLVESLLQVGVFLEAWHTGAPPAARGGVINFITGPSRTADIELTLTRGVHGPKEVHAVFVEMPLP